MVASLCFGVESRVHKIAVLRASALGDFIFALPALFALRSTYPRAEIVLLAREWHKQFLSYRPSPVDRVVVLPEGEIGNEGERRQDPIALEAFFEAMQREHFDIAIQMHGGGRNSNPFVSRLGARLTVGLRTADADFLDRWIPYVYYQPEIMRYLEVVSLVGATTDSLKPSIKVTEADRRESLQCVPEMERPVVVLHPGASDPRRRWATEKFARVGDALAREGVHVVLTGTKTEKQLVGAVISTMEYEAQDVSACLSLNGLAGLLSRCACVVSNDTGPLHLAGAVGTATVGIYWCGNLITAGPMTRALHRPAISWRLDCPVCGTNCTSGSCAHSASFVDDVSIEEVVDFAMDLLKQQGAFSQTPRLFKGVDAFVV